MAHLLIGCRSPVSPLSPALFSFPVILSGNRIGRPATRTRPAHGWREFVGYGVASRATGLTGRVGNLAGGVIAVLAAVDRQGLSLSASGPY
jgi:hypothetical protein